MKSSEFTSEGARRGRRNVRWRRFGAVIAAAVLVLSGGVSVLTGNGSVAHADGTYGAWVGENGLYSLTNAATGNVAIPVACIDSGRAEPKNAVNTVRTTYTAAKSAYLMHHFSTGDAVTRAALGVWAHRSTDLPHDHRTTPPAPTASVLARYNQLVNAANTQAGPYTMVSADTQNPTPTSSVVRKTFTVRSATGNGVPNVSMAFIGTGAATGLTPTSGTTNANGQIVVTYNLANTATGGVSATASGLAGTAVYMYSAPGAGSGYQRVISDGPPTSVKASDTSTRPANVGQVRFQKTSTTSTTSLPGAIYEVRQGTAGGPIWATITTAATWTPYRTIPAGRYVVVERSAPDGYFTDAPNQTIDVVNGGQYSVTFANTEKSKLVIIKRDGDTGVRLSGVGFAIEKALGVEIGRTTTNANGEIVTGWLDVPVGTPVKIIELNAKPGYDLAPPVTAVTTRTGAGTGTVTVNNFKTEIPRGRVSILKSDAESGALLAGAEFKVVNGGLTLATGTTNASGLWTSPVLTTLPLGWGVQIIETKAPAGYVLDPTPRIAYITTDGTGSARISMTNVADQSAEWVQLEKTDEVTGARVGGATFQLEVQKGGAGAYVPLSGGVVDGTFSAGNYVTATAGVNIGRIRLDAELTTPELEVGDRVRATETVAAPGYLLALDPADRVVTGLVSAGGTLSLAAVNAPQRSVQITKVSQVTGDPIPGAQLAACFRPDPTRTLAAGEAAFQAANPCIGGNQSSLVDVTGASVSLAGWYSMGTLDPTDVDGLTGSVASPWVRSGDEMLVTESLAPAGFSLSSVVARTTVTDTGWAPECTNIPGAAGGGVFTGTVVQCTFEDPPLTQVTITKSIVDGTGAIVPAISPAGATYRVTDAQETVLFNTGPTGPDGVVTFSLEGLAVGDVLTFTETNPPLGSALNPTPFTGTVAASDTGDLVVVVSQEDMPLAIGTLALSPEESKLILPGGTLVDTVSYDGLVPGTTYDLAGSLQAVQVDGTVVATGITASAQFTPTTISGTVDVTFTLPATFTPGIYVVFEQLLLDGEVIARHEDPNSPEQTFFVPAIGTSASDQSDGDKFLTPGGTIVDVISYSGFIPGVEAVAVGELMSVVDGVATPTGILSAPVTFTPLASSGTVEVTFTLPEDFVPGATLVVFEDVTVDGVVVSHRDATDEGQTVYVPEIGTSATDQEDGDKYLLPGGVVVDVVTYRGLQVGKTYTVAGELMEIVDGEAIGTGITGTANFTATTTDGSVEVGFTIPEDFEVGHTLVAFETVSYAGRVIAIHADAEDEGQTVYVPGIGTSAADQSDEDKFLKPGGVVVDTVTYAGLAVGVEHVATGELMAVVDGVATGTGIVGSTTFTPIAPGGTVLVELPIPADFVPGVTLVVFEDITVAGTVVGSHRNPTDEGQTVYVPTIGTTATSADDGGKSLTPGSVLVDTVAYSGLQPGVAYTLDGRVMAKNADGSVTETAVVATATFIAESSSGTTVVRFTLPADIPAGDYVVYEDLSVGGVIIADHRLPDSPSQSFFVPEGPPVPPVPTPPAPERPNNPLGAPPVPTLPPAAGQPPHRPLPNTGVGAETRTMVYLGAGLLGAGALALLIARRRRQVPGE